MENTTTIDTGEGLLLVTGYAVLAEGEAIEITDKGEAEAFAAAFNGQVFPVVKL